VIRLEDDFGIATGKELISLGTELRFKLAIIVDASVEHDSHAEVRIDHWLLRRRRKINDAQTPVTEPQVLLMLVAFGIRTSGPHRCRHRLQS
jgi:hypothetical protein